MNESPHRKRIAVTGASRGIGRVTALALAAQGHTVFALARSVTELDELHAQGQRDGFHIEPIRLDIADRASRQEAAKEILAATDGYGLDVLVNNAGYSQTGPIEEITERQLRDQFEVNVFGLLAFTQTFLPLMRGRRQGWIVNVSSIAGRVSVPFMGAYAASKFALEAVSDALRLELSPFQVHVVLIAPGPIRSNFGEVVRALAQDGPSSPYEPYLRRQKRAKQGSNLFERSPEIVARAIVHAVGSEHPRPRYTLTLPARLGAVARRLVPDTVTDWALRRAMGLGPARRSADR